MIRIILTIILPILLPIIIYIIGIKLFKNSPNITKKMALFSFLIMAGASIISFIYWGFYNEAMPVSITPVSTTYYLIPSMIIPTITT